MALDIAIQQIKPHPMNSNVMTDEQVSKLRRHIEQSGRYEPLVVRPLSADGDAPAAGTYQVLNGHHRLEVLRQLGRATARCEVWDVDDEQALVLLATLNRLEGRDDPMRRAALLARLAGAADVRRLAQLARLLPEDRAALKRAMDLAHKPLPTPLDPSQVAEPLQPMTFFLDGREHRTVERALGLARRRPQPSPSNAPPRETPATDADRRPHSPRADALVRLAESYLQSCAADTPEQPEHR
ncbi:MAG: ParB N-terminal domain-containing protein [Planctomycetes bacterium]|nr:ParB N-terminal domain-containing protein [Planctomycetota bacterium]